MSFTYRFRAECQADVLQLLKLIPPPIRFELLHLPLKLPDGSTVPVPDGYCEIETTMPITVLAAWMHSIPDGHVMVETLRLRDDYDGQRSHIPTDHLTSITCFYETL